MNSSMRLSILGFVGGLVSFCQAGVLVNDTWLDGTRTDPASPGYSEVGIDGDADGNLESAWFGSALSVVNGSPGVTPGILRGTVPLSGSASFTTYLTPEASPVTLANAGDQLRVTWIFTPTTVDTTNVSQSFRLAIVDSPARLSADGNPGDSTYAGYGMFMNMSTTFSNANPFRLMERAAPETSSALLSASASWAGLANDGVVGQTGYASGTEYTFLFTATRNALNGLDLTASMSGGSIGGDGTLEVNFTDATPNSFTFDTFAVRPSRADQSAAQFDTSRFMAEFTPIPEPSTIALAGLAALGLVLFGRRAVCR